MPGNYTGDACVTAVVFPSHRYVPGQTARHPEGWFDAVKAEDATALRTGVAYFEAGYFWECHEVLEAIWLRAQDGSDERIMVQAVIQLANARLKLVMARPKAAVRLCEIVGDLLGTLPAQAAPLGLSVSDWSGKLAQTRRML